MKDELSFYFYASMHMFMFIKDYYNYLNFFMTQGKFVLKLAKKTQEWLENCFSAHIKFFRRTVLDSNQVQWFQLVF